MQCSLLPNALYCPMLFTASQHFAKLMYFEPNMPSIRSMPAEGEPAKQDQAHTRNTTNNRTPFPELKFSGGISGSGLLRKSSQIPAMHFASEASKYASMRSLHAQSLILSLRESAAIVAISLAACSLPHVKSPKQNQAERISRPAAIERSIKTPALLKMPTPPT